MSGVMNLLEAAAKFEAVEHETKDVEHEIVVEACKMVCEEAKRVIGIGYPEWPALAPETLARKIGPGPLLETGELRDSIGWHAEKEEGWVGSDNDKAIWHELGTVKIPPRSFLAGAAIREEPKIHAMAAKAVMSVLSGASVKSAEVQTLIGALKSFR